MTAALPLPHELQSYWHDVITSSVPQFPLSVYGGLSILNKATVQEASAKTTPTKDTDDLYVAGYGSPQIIDQQRHLITKEALANDLPRFLANPKYRNVNLLHTNIQCGEVVPQWRNPETGEVFSTKVDDIGLFVVVKIRTDWARPPIVDEVIRDIKRGKIAAFSISADAPFDARRYVCKDGTCFYIIDRIYLYEITLCLPAGTLVWTKIGLKAIQDVVTGDLVWTHRNRWRPVTATMRRQTAEPLITIITASGDLQATREHPFLVRNSGLPEFVPAGDLRPGDLLVRHNAMPSTSEAKLVAVTQIREQAFAGTVYNLEVEEDHSYALQEAMSHNCEKPVNQDALFTQINKAYPSVLSNEYRAASYCTDGSCPVDPAAIARSQPPAHSRLDRKYATLLANADVPQAGHPLPNKGNPEPERRITLPNFRSARRG